MPSFPHDRPWTPRPAAKIHGWVPMGHDPSRRRVDVRLFDTRTTRDVFWSPGYNSYVLAEAVTPGATEAERAECLARGGTWLDPEGKPCKLLSVNGMGEVRWLVEPGVYHNPEERAAVAHFGLRPA